MDVLKLTFSLLLMAGSAFAALPAGLETAVEAEAVGVIAQIDDVQSIHITGHARYWQGTNIHSVHPADGNERTPDRLDVAIRSLETWDEKGINVRPNTKSNYAVHEYDGPSGKGYIIIQSVISGADTYQRLIDKGPEGRSTDWQNIGAI